MENTSKIESLYDLNETINNVATRALEVVAERTSSGQYFVDYDDVADLISHEDWLQYGQMIAYELSGRPEVLDEVVLEDGALDINIGLAYCKYYELTGEDDSTWGDEDFWTFAHEKTEPISHPLSLNRMAQIGQAAVSFIMESSDKPFETLTECVGLSMEELKQFKDPTVSKDAQSKVKPLVFSLEVKGNPSQTFTSFDFALEEYKSVSPDLEKSIDVIVPYKEEGPNRYRLLESVRNPFIRNKPGFVPADVQDDPNIALVYAKAQIFCYPFDEKSWSLRDWAEKELGITERIVDTSKDYRQGKWRVHIVPTGGRYGLHNALINDKAPTVEFYDLSADKVKFPDGQFVTRYDAETLLHDKLANKFNPYPLGLQLDNDVEGWYVCPFDMKKIVSYLESSLAKLDKKPSLNEQIFTAHNRSASDSSDRSQSAKEIHFDR